jgi:hypothetical protein
MPESGTQRRDLWELDEVDESAPRVAEIKSRLRDPPRLADTFIYQRACHFWKLWFSSSAISASSRALC